MAKREITGQVVIVTNDGVKVLDAEVRREFNVHLDHCVFKFNYDGDYLLIGGARTVQSENPYARLAYDPARIQKAVNYAESKFFRLTLDFMRLAQWNPFSKYNIPLDSKYFRDNNIKNCPVDYTKRGFELDTQLYFKYAFTSTQVNFTETRYK